MKIELWAIGKTAFPYLAEGIEIYQKRIVHYNAFEIITLPDIKNAGNLPPQQLKIKEGENILAKLLPTDLLIILDERGQQPDSVALARHIEQWLQGSHRRIIFLIGGAFGFSPAVYERANHQIGLSRLTFSHQMVRLFVVEQIYRAMTILRGESYHNS